MLPRLSTASLTAACLPGGLAVGEKHTRTVTLSLVLGRLSLVVLRRSGLPESAHPEQATTPLQRCAMWLGALSVWLNHLGIGKEAPSRTDTTGVNPI